MPGGIETTPREELTGLPLPVLMRPNDFYFRRAGQTYRREANYHHHFHPKKSPELGYDLNGKKLEANSYDRIEGIGLRVSRGQLLPMWLHDRYHDRFYGPEMPQDSKTKFTTVVLACAGVVPREAIDLYDTEGFGLVDLDNRQYEFIRKRVYFEGGQGVLKKSKRDNIGQFLANYALTTSLAEVMSEKEVRKNVHEFLKLKNQEKKAKAGRFILEHAIDASVAELIPVHERARDEGMAERSSKGLGDFVMKFFTRDRFPDYFAPLEHRLAAVA